MNAPEHAEPAAVVSDTGAFVKDVAGAVGGSHSTLERVGETAAAVKLGVRIIPAAWQFAKRRPLSASLALVALAAAAYLILPGVRAWRRDRAAGP
jgi:hypothetical protein